MTANGFTFIAKLSDIFAKILWKRIEFFLKVWYNTYTEFAAAQFRRKFFVAKVKDEHG